MKEHNPYQIEFIGLKDGLHSYEFVMEDAFFDGFSREGFEQTYLQTQVTMQKDPSMLVFNIRFEGHAQMSCDLCLQTYQQGIQGQRHLVVRIDGDEARNPTEDEDLLVLDDKEISFDLAPYLNDIIQVTLPWTRRCAQNLSGEKACDPEMLKRIQAYQAKPEANQTEVDPRWDALKHLKLNS